MNDPRVMCEENDFMGRGVPTLVAHVRNEEARSARTSRARRAIAAPALVVLCVALAAPALAAKKGKRGRDGGPDPNANPSASSAPVAPSLPASGNAAPAVSAGASGVAAPHPDDVDWASCSEHIPPGATRPVLKESFPTRGTSGYASLLEITIEHGKGETVLPQGFQIQSSSAAAKVLTEAGFVLPSGDGGAGPVLTTTPTANGVSTKVTIPILLLPKEPGRNKMILPPVPIAVARASGELLTVCTAPHPVVVEDPTAQTPDAKPLPNPPPRQQIEEWTLAKQLTIGALVGAVLAAITAFLVARWNRRPRPVPPPPPPRPPWEVALEELFAVRYAGLAKEERFAEHYDRISDAVRKYLGGRYGFDGLETTSREMTAILKRVQPQVLELPVILGFLEECDLVKFARFTPSEEDCTRVLDQAEYIVRSTVPPQLSAPPPNAQVPATAEGGGA